MAMPEMQYVDSSNLDQIGYDGDSMELHIVFKSGAHYIYRDVPETVYEGLVGAASKGSYLNREVKNVYPYEQA